MNKKYNYKVETRGNTLFFVFPDTYQAWDYFHAIRDSVACRIVCFGQYENAIEF